MPHTARALNLKGRSLSRKCIDISQQPKTMLTTRRKRYGHLPLIYRERKTYSHRHLCFMCQPALYRTSPLYLCARHMDFYHFL